MCPCNTCLSRNSLCHAFWKTACEQLHLTCPHSSRTASYDTFCFGSAAEDGGASKAEPASAALIAVANSCGVRYPKLLCGRSSLYSRSRAELVHQIAEDVGSNNTQVKRT